MQKNQNLSTIEERNDENIEKYLTSIIFREAIYLASLSLFNETKTKISEKSKVSLVKYYNRALVLLPGVKTQQPSNLQPPALSGRYCSLA